MGRGILREFREGGTEVITPPVFICSVEAEKISVLSDPHVEKKKDIWSLSCTLLQPTKFILMQLEWSELNVHSGCRQLDGLPRAHTRRAPPE